MINVFISYSHRDLQFKEELEKHLTVLKRSALIQTWTDYDIKAGEEWNKETQERIEKADLIILLISADLLASDFIYSSEIEKIFLNDNKNILPVIVRPCAWQDIEILRKRQVFPENGKPIASYDDRDKAFSNLTSLLTKWIYEIQNQEKGLHDTSPSLEVDLRNKLEGRNIFISHCHEDGDFAELLKLRLEKEGFQVWIDTDRLKIGQVWREEIDEAIRKSTAFIVIMTPEARNSEYVTYEWAFAWGVNIKIFPIQLKKTTFHPRLESLQYLDFSNRESRPWDKLLIELK
jgi:hypothetical protein